MGPFFGMRLCGSIRRWMGIPVATLVLAATAAPAQAKGGWVNGDFFGINFQQLRELGPTLRDKHLERIAGLGIHEMRIGFAWPRIEPFHRCASKRVYRHLKNGRYRVEVRAIDRTGAKDPTPAKRRFRIHHRR